MTEQQTRRVQTLRRNGHSLASAIRTMNREQTAMRDREWRAMGQWETGGDPAGWGL